ncbi:MAG: hypothetical protein EX285_02385 [Thaumarchaeota archaeon]|nr:hypothetical protein [Nitrososphaerota archaeon]NMJ86681.1 hypothetical protein [Nitrososphaerota archaeon]|tara:strand:- start:518 stop:736 length:219 start_codon:yes stop_codon:yes gene_type:complete
MGRISKGVNCNVNGCNNSAVRSLNTNRVKDAGLDINTGSKQSYLCKDHYKEWKKEIKQNEKDDVSLRYGGGF